jgi:hypothetical protein
MPHSAEPTRKSTIARLEHDLAAELIAELAVQRHDDRRTEQIGCHDPRQVIESTQFADNRWERGRHYRLIKRSEQHDQQQRGEQQADRRVVGGPFN